MFCRQCGKEIPPDSDFCGYCGAATGTAASAGTPPPPPPPPPTPGYQQAPPPPSTYQQATPYAPPPKKSALPWILGALGVAVVVAVALVLIFVVFKGGSDAAGPEKVVENFFKALEKKNVSMLLDVMEPDFVDELKEAFGRDYKDILEEYVFTFVPDDLKVDIRKMDTKIKGNRAEVTVLEGTMTYTDESGDRVREEASESDMDYLELVKIEGRWYLTSESLADMGVDIEVIEDYLREGEDLEDDYTDYKDAWPDESESSLPVDSEEEAVDYVFKEFPDVFNWYMAVETADVEVTDEGDSYQVHFFEYVEDDVTGGHTATYGWYAVDKETGEVFEITY